MNNGVAGVHHAGMGEKAKGGRGIVVNLED